MVHDQNYHILNFDADIGKLTLIENIVHAFKYLLYPVLNNDLSSDVILIRIREAVCVQIVELWFLANQKIVTYWAQNQSLRFFGTFFFFFFISFLIQLVKILNICIFYIVNILVS